MFAKERQDRILQLLNEKGAVKISELTGIFSVSVETIRRDLMELEHRNCLSRVHGGALRIPRSGEYPVRSERAGKNRERKEELAGYAARMIRENDIIMVDCGSTATEFSRMLADRFEKLTVITNSLDVFEMLRTKEKYELYLSSGFFMNRENAFYGPWALEFLERFHAGTAFLFPSAISLQYGIMDYDRELFAVQKKMMELSDRVIFLADSEKFEKSGFLKLADAKEGCMVVTDSGLKDEIYGLYRENQIEIIRGE